MPRTPRRRVLAGPFEGHLPHRAVRDLFHPYGKVLYGGWYHYTSDPLHTWGYVDFETEAEAENAIQGLRNGSFITYGKTLRMLNVVNVGMLPMSLDEWIGDLSFGWTYEPIVAGAGDKGKATEPPSPTKLDDPADVHTGIKGKSPILLKLYDPADVDTGDEDQAEESLALIAVHGGAHTSAPDSGRPAEAPK